MSRCKISYFFFAGLAMLLLSACGGNGSTVSGNGQDSSSTGVEDAGQGGNSFEAGGLKVSELEGSIAYPSASLGLVSPPRGADLMTGKNHFEFSLSGMDLGKATSDQASRGVLNGETGQYIALILNNQPQISMNAASTDQELTDGHYVMLAFPNRSYHQSVKVPGSHVLAQFNVGQPDNYKELDTKAPHLFYHWPTGTISGNGGSEKVLLDFYLVNCDLAPDGFKVIATINGTPFTLTKWASYTIEGLPMGENKIKLELQDATGKTVASPFNPVERTFVVGAGA